MRRLANEDQPVEVEVEEVIDQPVEENEDSTDEKVLNTEE